MAWLRDIALYWFGIGAFAFIKTAEFYKGLNGGRSFYDEG